MRVRLGIFLLALVGGVTPCLSAEYQFETLNYPGAADTWINDINDSGTIVGVFGDINPNRSENPGMLGFVYDGNDFSTIEFPNSSQTSVGGINDSGLVVGEYVVDGNAHGFVFDGSEYQTIDFPGAQHSSVADINESGVMVGTYLSGGIFSTPHGFIYDGRRFTSYDLPGDVLPPIATGITGINNSGEMVGTSTIVLLDQLPEIVDFVVGFRNPGEQIIDYSTVGGRDRIPGTFVENISNEGMVAGRYVYAHSADRDSAELEFRGFLFDSNDETFTEVDLPGVECTFHGQQFAGDVPEGCNRSLRAVNSSGTIVGYYDNNDSMFHGFIGRLSQDEKEGDFNADGELNLLDLDLLYATVANGSHAAAFDLTADNIVDHSDAIYWVDRLANTWIGDANLDGEFNSTDFINVFAANEYEDDVANNSTWGTGDWNGDFDFDSSDFIAAFSNGGYEKGRRIANAVPEPSSSLAIFVIGLMSFGLRRQLEGCV